MVIPIIQRTQRVQISPLDHTPKPDGAMERFRLPEVLCDNGGALQRGL
jgi:hypothetical protein